MAEGKTDQQRRNLQKEIFIAATPNTQPDDIKLARELLYSSSKWHSYESSEKASEELASVTGVKSAYLFDSGRASLYAILVATGIGKGDEVILQAYTCLAVPTAIMWSGATPIFVDIPADSYNASAEEIQNAITNKTRAVIIQHTFGELSDIEGIQKVIDAANKKRSAQDKIILIEDLAHSLGQSFNGKPLGSHGDAAFCSFGQEKVVSCTRGGAAVSTDKTISKDLAGSHQNVPRNSHFFDEKSNSPSIILGHN